MSDQRPSVRREGHTFRGTTEDTWHTIAVTGSGFAAVAGQTPSCRLASNGDLQLRGAVTRSSGSSGTTLFTLGADYAPAAPYRIAAFFTPLSTVTAVALLVNTDGTVVLTWSGTAPTNIALELSAPTF